MAATYNVIFLDPPDIPFSEVVFGEKLWVGVRKGAVEWKMG